MNELKGFGGKTKPKKLSNLVSSYFVGSFCFDFRFILNNYPSINKRVEEFKDADFH